MSLSLLFEITLAEYHAGKFPLWVAQIPGEELLWDMGCENIEDNELGLDSARTVRCYRRVRKAA